MKASSMVPMLFLGLQVSPHIRQSRVMTIGTAPCTWMVAQSLESLSSVSFESTFRKLLSGFEGDTWHVLFALGVLMSASTEQLSLRNISTWSPGAISVMFHQSSKSPCFLAPSLRLDAACGCTWP